jgi:hypothetical protein
MIKITEGAHWAGVLFDPKTKDTTMGTSQYLPLIACARAEFSKRFPIEPGTARNPPTLLERMLRHQTVQADELDRYLLAPPCQTTEHQSKWFTQMSFSKIFQLYRIYCSPPGSAVSIERLWSLAGHLITRRRSRMSADHGCQILQYKKNSKVARDLTREGDHHITLVLDSDLD